jgi:hypothetical protein
MNTTMRYPNGTKLTGLGLNLTLEDTELLTEAGSCAEDMWMYHWATPEGRSFLTTDIELAGYLADGATLS